jgi:hypothetical protein
VTATATRSATPAERRRLEDFVSPKASGRPRRTLGLFVALPAVVAYNFFQRALRRATQRANALGHAAVARMKAR